MQKMVQGTTCGVGEPQWEVQGTDASASANCIMCRAQAQACIALPAAAAVRGIREPRGAGVVQGTTCGISAAMRGIGEPRRVYGWMQSARSRCKVRCRAPTRAQVRRTARDAGHKQTQAAGTTCG